MERVWKQWMRYSIKRKIIILIILTMNITMLFEGITMYLSFYTLSKFEKIMDNNSVYQKLQGVIKEEQETFIAYIRNRTDENKIAFEAACENSEKCVAALPFDYYELGEERYARTWNIVNGYNGYIAYRDEIMGKTEEDADYIDVLYDVLGMQENLSNYALKLVQVTLEQWNTVYKEQVEIFRVLPVVVILTSFIILGVLMIFWHFLSESIISPIVTIAEDSRKIAVNDFNTPQLSVENQDEIGDLVAAFNKMKCAMNQYISTLEEKNRISELLHKEALEKVELEKQFEHAQLEVLKHQVNPHFLFNTLNMISSMAKLEDADTTDSMIVSLGNLFRYNLRTVEQEVYLEQELEVLDDYIYIQQMRFDDRIEYEKMIEVDRRKVKIPSFTLQPIVENAFVHGVSSMEEGGKIAIKIWQEEQNVCIMVTDNGCGMSEEVLKQLNEKIHEKNISGRGIGLGNICRRIDMMYPDGEFHIYSTEGEGTVVRLVIPQCPGEEVR